jgi:hypothetical protein
MLLRLTFSLLLPLVLRFIEKSLVGCVVFGDDNAAFLLLLLTYCTPLCVILAVLPLLLLLSFTSAFFLLSTFSFASLLFGIPHSTTAVLLHVWGYLASGADDIVCCIPLLPCVFFFLSSASSSICSCPFVFPLSAFFYSTIGLRYACVRPL